MLNAAIRDRAAGAIMGAFIGDVLSKCASQRKQCWKN